MNFPSIDIQGSILSNDLLAKIRGEQANFQQGKDFNSDFTNAKLKDDISLAWQEAKGQWTIYKSKLARLKEGENGTTETRNFWISPLLTNLNYNLTFNRQAEELNGKSFPIGYRDSVLDNFPLYVGGYHESLDKRPENKQLRVSPHAMLQEYLNYSEHLYGIVTNGKQLRLLRDASRITRLSYIEFNLEKMMEEDLYSDFVIFYRLLHASRMPKRIDAGADSIIEKYHQEGLEAGSTIRNKLGDAVKGAILNLANGFIKNPNNTELRSAFENGTIDLGDYYRHQLRIIYRLLFLFVIEERNLVYADSKTPETKRFSQIYFNHYSLSRLRKLAKKIVAPESNRHHDLWKGLVSTFSLFEKKEIGEKLGIMSLQGDLFGYNAIANDYYDLHNCSLSNSILLNIIKSLSYFENENQTLIAVNYGGLDVEEFGSVYEGLLELQLSINKIEGTDEYSCNFDGSNERGKSGSHYTPEELVQPLIKHSLEYLIEDRLKPYQQKKVNKENTVTSLLQLKICDVACGSGHILLSAARRVALEIARIQSEEEQPNPLAIRKAMKDVVRNCIYGVDKNPLAVELCKIALWLEAYNPGEPLNFLDHHIKCGDAIVGLAQRSELETGIADEAFKTLTGDDKDIAKGFRDKNIKERKQRAAKVSQLKADFEKATDDSLKTTNEEFMAFTKMPENTPEEIESKADAYKRFIEGEGVNFLKAMADTKVAQFFISKTTENKDVLITDADFRLILSGHKDWQDIKVAKAKAVALEERFFHWFIEFPEVFAEGGFDCVLGNPPYLGDKKQKKAFGEFFLEYIRSSYSVGINDLVVYFFNRIYQLIRDNRYEALITTSSISQGDMRTGALDNIQSSGGTIIYAIRSLKWPGVANLNIALVVIKKGSPNRESIELNGKKEKYISSFLTSEVQLGEPYKLKANEDLMYTGIYFLGDGFLISNEKAHEIITTDSKYKDVVFPFINGDDINDSVEQENSRSIINFFDWSLDKEYDNTLKIPKGKPFVIDYPMCHEIIDANVKAERQRWKLDENGNEIIGEYALDKTYREKWWQFARSRPELRKATKDLRFIFATAQTTKYLNFVKLNTSMAVSQTAFVFATDRFDLYVILQSIVHFEWALKYGNSKGDTFRYAPASTFETFPFPQNINPDLEQQLKAIGQVYHEHRRKLMTDMQLGLTKTYNLFHSNAITAKIENGQNKQVIALQKHLEKTPNTISFNESIQSILKLRELHVKMDEIVLYAYQWNDIQLYHDFYEVDYLPENDRIRFTIHPDARKEVLKRLLELNHRIHEEEVAAILLDVKPAKKSKKKETSPSQNELF
jgi:methylase of polypeptide subunit release factors